MSPTDSVGDVATAGCRGSDKAPIVHSREIEAAPSCDFHLQNCDTIMLTQQPATGVSDPSLNDQDRESL